MEGWVKTPEQLLSWGLRNGDCSSNPKQIGGGKDSYSRQEHHGRSIGGFQEAPRVSVRSWWSSSAGSWKKVLVTLHCLCSSLSLYCGMRVSPSTGSSSSSSVATCEVNIVPAVHLGQCFLGALWRQLCRGDSAITPVNQSDVAASFGLKRVVGLVCKPCIWGGDVLVTFFFPHQLLEWPGADSQAGLHPHAAGCASDES